MKYEQFEKLIEAFSEPYSEPVYHYTSADGVSGIIANHEIWMSNTEFTNDTKELKMLSENQTIFTDNDFTNYSVKKAWHNSLENYNNKYGESFNYYMASFSKRKDSLEQWRAYGNYCIGFDANQLGSRKRVVLYSCLYTEEDIRQWILKNEKIDEWKGLTDKELTSAAAFYLLNVASMKYKNNHFKSEEEVRLITTSSHHWFYDNSPEMYEDDLPIHCRRHPVYGFPVPFVKFFIEQDNKNDITRAKEKEMEMKTRKLKEEGTKEKKLLPITEVIVGPMAYQEEAKVACEILLADRGYKSIKVRKSDIPYRGA